MKASLKHFEDNRSDYFDSWIRARARLQAGMDILKPLIPDFLEANPGVNINSCQDCIIDMLVWYSIELKNYKKDEQPTKGKANKQS